MQRDTERHEPINRHGKRGWTLRLTGPIQYRRYTAKGSDGIQRIFFEFKLLSGQNRLPPEIFAVMDDSKTHPDGHKSFLKSKNNGTLWYLPDHEHGRGMADQIDMALQALARQMDSQSAHFR